jgi:hypothetical protein
MVLFSLFSLMDAPDAYKNALKRLIRHRKRALYQEIGISFEDDDPNQVDYYTILDLEFLGERAYEREFLEWLLNNTKPSELLFRLKRRSFCCQGAGSVRSTPPDGRRLLDDAQVSMAGPQTAFGDAIGLAVTHSQHSAASLAFWRSIRPFFVRLLRRRASHSQAVLRCTRVGQEAELILLSSTVRRYSKTPFSLASPRM